MVDLTVTIVSYHGYEDICKVVEAINTFTDKNITKRLFIVDNANEPEVFTGLAEKYDFVEYLNPEKNLGFGQGHNFVLEKLNSRYHTIVNPDIEINEDVFSKLIAFMESDDEIGAACPKIVDQNGDIQRVYRRQLRVSDVIVRMFLKGMFKKKQDRHTMQDMDYSKPFQVPFAQGSFLMFRTDLFRQLGGFDDRYFMYVEDADLCRRINSISKVMYCPDTTVVHRWEKGSHKNKQLMKWHMQSMFRYFRKWGLRG